VIVLSLLKTVLPYNEQAKLLFAPDYPVLQEKLFLPYQYLTVAILQRAGCRQSVEQKVDKGQAAGNMKL
jgi:hypothetical protein